MRLEGLRLLYISVAPAEELLLAHVCPGNPVARLVAAGSPWRCRLCRWAEITGTEGLVEREAGPRELSLLRIHRVPAVLLDGPEPLHRLGGSALALPRLLEEAGVEARHIGLYTMGLLGPRPLQEARSSGYDFLVFEYTLPLEKPPALPRVLEALEAGYREYPVLEIIVHHDGSREATVTAHGLAERYPEAAIHILAREGAEDKAYEAAERIREKLGVNAYPHPEESYTLLDTQCTRCHATLVQRRPWGVRVEALPGDPARCPSCGARQRLHPCPPRRPMALHREVVIW